MGMEHRPALEEGSVAAAATGGSTGDVRGGRRVGIRRIVAGRRCGGGGTAAVPYQARREMGEDGRRP